MSGEWADQPAADNHGIPGKTLAAAREAMGWSVEQIADQLKMAVRQVVALEAGDYASLPGPAVVRGFVRAYAKVVRLDPAPLVAQIALDAPEAGIAGSMRRDRPASFSEVRFPSHGKRSKLPVLPMLAVALIVAAGVAVWKFDLVPASLTGGSAAPAAETTAVLTETVPTVAPSNPALQDPSVPLISVPPPATAAGTAPGAASPAGAGPVQGVATPAAATPDAAAAAAVTPPAATAPAVPAPAAPDATAPAAAGANALVVNVREDSWVEVRDAKGKALMRGMVKAGETKNIDIAGPSILIVGKPGAVTATLRGAPVELPPMKGSTISRVKVQ